MAGVLLVDDEAEIGRTSVMFQESAGHEVESAETVAEAMTVARHFGLEVATGG